MSERKELFYSLVTRTGQAQISNALALNKTIVFENFLIGDGGGAYYEPTEDMTSLKGEKWRGKIESMTVGESNPDEIIINAYIPSDVGGFFIREFGITDKEGNLLIVGKHPETHKPNPVDGASKDLMIRVVLKISNAEKVIIKIDPSVKLLTQADIDRHNTDPKAHGGLFDSHTKDRNIHVTKEQKDQWTEGARLTLDHVQNADIHVTLDDKTKWNDGSTKAGKNEVDIASLMAENADLKAQIEKLQQLLLTDIRENEISIAFDNLTGIKVSSGNYNADRKRVEV
uniref:phage tail protein n=1 Tax=Anaerococcus mediterraneensis TaxID=1870984 RepID=UPI0012FED987|nr:phage tail protein [Anaerococcus mediterraneensis]